MILQRWSSFRWKFAEGVHAVELPSIAITFTEGPPATLGRAAGSFITDGVQVGHRLDIIGSTLNDGQYTADIVAALLVTLSSDDALADDGPEAVTLVSGSYDPDGAPRWPIAEVRSGGFDAGIEVISADPPEPWWKALSSGVAVITVNDQDPDVSPSDEYHWYLSQRSDEADGKIWTIVQKPDIAPSKFSGTVHLQLSALGQALFGSSLDTEEIPEALRNVHLYVKRVSDNAVQWIDLFKHAMGAV